MHSLPRALAAVVAAAGLALAIVAAPARAQAPEQILDYGADLQIETDGTLLVAERIAYDFGTAERHGILRDLPVRFGYDDRYDRVYPVEVLEVSATPGNLAMTGGVLAVVLLVLGCSGSRARPADG